MFDGIDPEDVRKASEATAFCPCGVYLEPDEVERGLCPVCQAEAYEAEAREACESES